MGERDRGVAEERVRAAAGEQDGAGGRPVTGQHDRVVAGDRDRPVTDERVRVVVIGAGASGTLAAVHLLRSGVPVELVLVDRSGEFGPGRAYRTGDPGHLLNTVAEKMSAFDDDPEHFVRWSGAEPGAFLPRRDYGRYLAQTLAAEEQQAENQQADRQAVVRHVADTAVGLSTRDDGVTVELARTGPVHADFAVLAPGAGGGDPLADLLPDGSPRYVADPWAGPLPDTGGAPVLVLGTGLSMMDIAVSLAPDSPLHAVSRHGLLPRPHRRKPGAPSFPDPPEQIGSLGELLRFARRCVSADPERWREFVDHLRPHTRRLWRQLGVAEQRRFLERVHHYWNVHRHRAAPDTHRAVRALLASGRLRLHRGRVEALTPVQDGFEVVLTGGQALRVGWLVNATGFRRDGGPLVRELVAEGTARPDPVGLGVRTGADGRVLDRWGTPRRVFTLGALRRGEEFESTAVPEIRAQAAEIAAHVRRGVMT
ncbi:FAD/NAD(P)-binding protein [Lentzea sp. NPDC042327]|uniref:FAD/NAD(P)-binding protein n=1 Tax=Lentzea sp. NPDC042327 TaxID=3154801 RepID=UPI0033DB10DA